MNTKHDANPAFIASKCFDTLSLTGLHDALKWLKSSVKQEINDQKGIVL